MYMIYIYIHTSTYGYRFTDDSLIPNFSDIPSATEQTVISPWWCDFFPSGVPCGLSSDHPITIQLSSYHPISSQLSVKLDDNLMITGWYQFSVIIQLSSICLFRFQVLVLLFSLLFLWSCVSGKSATARAASVAWWCGDDVGSRQATGQKLRRSGSQWRTGESLENNSTIWGYQLNSIDIYIYVYCEFSNP